MLGSNHYFQTKISILSNGALLSNNIIKNWPVTQSRSQRIYCWQHCCRWMSFLLSGIVANNAMQQQTGGGGNISNGTHCNPLTTNQQCNATTNWEREKHSKWQPTMHSSNWGRAPAGLEKWKLKKQEHLKWAAHCMEEWPTMQQLVQIKIGEIHQEGTFKIG